MSESRQESTEGRVWEVVERAKNQAGTLGSGEFRPGHAEAIHLAWEYALALVALAKEYERLQNEQAAPVSPALKGETR